MTHNLQAVTRNLLQIPEMQLSSNLDARPLKDVMGLSDPGIPNWKLAASIDQPLASCYEYRSLATPIPRASAR